VNKRQLSAGVHPTRPSVCHEVSEDGGGCFPATAGEWCCRTGSCGGAVEAYRAYGLHLTRWGYGAGHSDSKTTECTWHQKGGRERGNPEVCPRGKQSNAERPRRAAP
jgi:hypothetical protein